MRIKMKALPSAILGAVGFAMISAPAIGQQPAPKVEKIEVTGSNIRRVDSEGPAPVVVLKREDLERSGGQNLQEGRRALLHGYALAPYFFGQTGIRLFDTIVDVDRGLIRIGTDFEGDLDFDSTIGSGCR